MPSIVWLPDPVLDLTDAWEGNKDFIADRYVAIVVPSFQMPDPNPVSGLLDRRIGFQTPDEVLRLGIRPGAICPNSNLSVNLNAIAGTLTDDDSTRSCHNVQIHHS